MGIFCAQSTVTWIWMIQHLWPFNQFLPRIFFFYILRLINYLTDQPTASLKKMLRRSCQDSNILSTLSMFKMLSRAIAGTLALGLFPAGFFPAVFSPLGLSHAGFFPAGMDFLNFFYFEQFQEKKFPKKKFCFVFFVAALFRS